MKNGNKIEFKETSTPDENLTLIPPGKIQCIITGKLRPETPEEHVRQRVLRSLIEEYGYDKTDIEVEFSVNLGRSKKKGRYCYLSTQR
jgi:type I restriction enzyme M protein